MLEVERSDTVTPYSDYFPSRSDTRVGQTNDTLPGIASKDSETPGDRKFRVDREDAADISYIATSCGGRERRRQLPDGSPFGKRQQNAQAVKFLSSARPNAISLLTQGYIKRHYSSQDGRPPLASSLESDALGNICDARTSETPYSSNLPVAFCIATNHAQPDGPPIS